MKKIVFVAAVLVLTTAVLAGCRNPDTDMTVAPTGPVTTPSIMPTTPATQPATRPTEEPTIGEGGTMPSGNPTNPQSPSTGEQGRSRMPMNR